MVAKDRDAHRDMHIARLGVTQYIVAGTHLYTVPVNVDRLKVQIWGAGGGSGFFKERKGGTGGGGAFVEAILEVRPYDVLEIVVGSGGEEGKCGLPVADIDVTLVREEAKIRFKRQMFMTSEQRAEDTLLTTVLIPKKLKNNEENNFGIPDPKDLLANDKHRAIAKGGLPGGGEGYGGHGTWGGGGGGAYSLVSNRTAKGSQALLLAAGGGGGGSSDGCPGGGCQGVLPGTRIQPRNGTTATLSKAGDPGDSGSVLNAMWGGSPGLMWRGGNGSEYGGGGGSGYYGGGGKFNRLVLCV